MFRCYLKCISKNVLENFIFIPSFWKWSITFLIIILEKGHVSLDSFPINFKVSISITTRTTCLENVNKLLSYFPYHFPCSLQFFYLNRYIITRRDKFFTLTNTGFPRHVEYISSQINVKFDIISDMYWQKGTFSATCTFKPVYNDLPWWPLLTGGRYTV